MISEKINLKPGPAPGPAIILDLGSFVKAGNVEESQILVNEPAIVASYPPELDTYSSLHGPYVGEDALAESSKSPSLNFSFPIECGLPVLMQDAELVFKHVVENRLRDSLQHRGVILTKKSLTPKKFLRDLCKSMFETFQVHRLSFVNSDLASLHLSGNSTGVVVDLGASQVMITPIVDNLPQMHAIRRLELGGRDITEYFQKQLEESSGGLLKFRSAAEVDVVRQLKEKACTVAADWEDPITLKEALDANEKIFELPDGTDVRVGFPRVRAPEILFHPGLSGSALEDGLHHKIFSSIMACDINVRRDLYSRIVIVGGTSNLAGLDSRLQRELSFLVPAGVNVKVVAPEDRGCYPFMGAQMQHERLSWITRDAYESMDLSELPL